jgi:hypothetical protein
MDNFKEAKTSKIFGIPRLANSIEYSLFARDQMSQPHEDVLKGGFTTASALSGKIGAFQRADPLRLAEIYEVDTTAERLTELLR